MEEESSSRSGPRLGQLLRRQHAEREPGIDERRRQIVSDAGTALPHIVESNIADIGEPLFDALKSASIE
jgi:hypothetical protein